MYQDYLHDIIKYYWIRAGNASLPQRLIRPTPAGIKEECLAACQARFRDRDYRLLTAFFSTDNDEAAILKAIGRCDRDRFKPLSNFLRGITSTTDDLNIELLAWLIDFSDRPYKREEYSEKLPVTESVNPSSISSDPQQVENNIVESIAGDSRNADADKMTENALSGEPDAENTVIKGVTFPNTVQKIAIAVICLLLFSLISFYFFKDRKPLSGIFNKGQQQCMIWVGDHYIQSSCEPKHGDTLVVAFDLQRFRNFKRITRPDTITLLSEDKLWYIKRNGHIEYYTAGGRHPIEPDRVLRPLTRYMILKYQNSPEY